MVYFIQRLVHWVNGCWPSDEGGVGGGCDGHIRCFNGEDSPRRSPPVRSRHRKRADEAGSSGSYQDLGVVNARAGERGGASEGACEHGRQSPSFANKEAMVRNRRPNRSIVLLSSDSHAPRR